MGNFDFSELQKKLLLEITPQQKELLNIAKNLMTPVKKTISVLENEEMINLKITRKGCGILDTPHGNFWMITFELSDRWSTYNVLLNEKNFDPKSEKVTFDKKEPIILRTDSGCCTGQIFEDATCECCEQLHYALKEISQNPNGGLLIHIPEQDGRGKGLPFKLATLFLQKEGGFNTVEAASLLDAHIDERTYGGVVGILKFFEITPHQYTIALATNNPQKRKNLEDNGYKVFKKAVQIKPTEKTKIHLVAKQEFLDHNLGLEKQNNKGI